MNYWLRRLFCVPGGTPSFGLNGYVPLNTIWFSASWVLNRVYNFAIYCILRRVCFCTGSLYLIKPLFAPEIVQKKSVFKLVQPFCGHYLLVGKVFRKAFRILGLDERKGRWIVERNFHENFRVNHTWLFAFPLTSLTESCSFSYGLKDLFTLHKLAD